MYVIKNFSTGEIWEIEDHVMKRSGYFYRRILEELKWAYRYHHDKNCSPADDFVWAEILYRDEYEYEKHIGSIYYREADNYKVTAWYIWRNNESYCHSCYNYSDK